MSNWKFKIGDVVKDKYNKYTILKCDDMINCYEIMFEKERMFVYKDPLEAECELVKPKSLYEQALDLLGLNTMEDFMFMGQKYYFDKVGNLVCSYGLIQFKEISFGLTELLFHKDKITKPKSEAELILDELKIVVDKANDILRKSGK